MNIPVFCDDELKVVSHHSGSHLSEVQSVSVTPPEGLLAFRRPVLKISQIRAG